MKFYITFLLSLSVLCEVNVSFQHVDGNAKSLRHFDGYVVLRLTPSTKPQLSLLNEMVENITFYSQPLLDFWTPPRELEREVDVMISPQIRPEVEKLFSKWNIDSRILIDDVEK